MKYIILGIIFIIFLIIKKNKEGMQVSGNIVTHNGKQYRTLTGQNPGGGGGNRCENSARPIPAGWKVADDTADSRAVISGYNWNTDVIVLSNGKSYGTKNYSNGRLWNSNMLRKSGNSVYTGSCSLAILLTRGGGGGQSNKYTKMPKNTNCPAGTSITSNPECQQAIRDLGLKYDPWWHGNHDQIPAGCTWTDAVLNNHQRGSLSHWNAWTHSPGKPRYDLHPICKTQPQGGILDYAPKSIKEIINKTYIGPSSEDAQLCKKLGKSHMPCGNVSGSGSNRCIRSIVSCKQFNGCGSHTNHCGTCMKRVPKAPPPGQKPNQAPGLAQGAACAWRNWTAWSPCDRQCAGGKQQRFRNNNGYCYSGGKKINSSSEERACNTHPCPRGISGQQGERGYRGPRGPAGDRGPPGKSGGIAGFPGISGAVGQRGSEGEVGYGGAKGPLGFQGPEGDVVSKAQTNNNLLTSIYDKLLKIGGGDEENFSLLNPYNNSKYN